MCAWQMTEVGKPLSIVELEELVFGDPHSPSINQGPIRIFSAQPTVVMSATHPKLVSPTGHRDVTEEERTALLARFDDVWKRVRQHSAGWPWENDLAEQLSSVPSLDRKRCRAEGFADRMPNCLSGSTWSATRPARLRARGSGCVG